MLYEINSEDTLREYGKHHFPNPSSIMGGVNERFLFCRCGKAGTHMG